MANVIKFTLTVECDLCDADGCEACDGGEAETEFQLPAKYEVCSRCAGEGKHVNPNIDGHGITAEEWDRDWDEDSREGYFSGRYDVPCERCAGCRVEAVVDEERLTAKQRELYTKYQEVRDQRARWDAEDRATQRMESGGFDC